MSEDIWEQLALLTGTSARLQQDIDQCVGNTMHKKELEMQLSEVLAERQHLMAALCEIVPSQIAD